MAEEKKEKAEGKKGLPFVAKVLIIAIVLILIVVISVGSAFFIASKMSKSSGDGSNTVENTKTETSSKEGEASTSYGKTVEFGEYTVNIKIPAGEDAKYMVVKINFELNPELDEKKLVTVETDIEEKKIILQDVMLSILRNKTQIELEEDVNYEKLKKELTEACNKVLGEEFIKTIRFNNLLVQ